MPKGLVSRDVFYLEAIKHAKTAVETTVWADKQIAFRNAAEQLMLCGKEFLSNISDDLPRFTADMVQGMQNAAGNACPVVKKFADELQSSTVVIFETAAAANCAGDFVPEASARAALADVAAN